MVDGTQILACGYSGFDRRVEIGNEGARAGESGLDVARRLEGRSATGDELLRFERRNRIERMWPVFVIRVAAIRRSVVFDQVAGEQDLVLRQPDHRVAFGVATAELQDLHFELPEPQRHLALEHEIGPGEARHRFDRLKEARKALDLALHVLCAAFDDEVARILARNDVLGLVRRRTQYAHSVVMRQDDILDRLIGDFADATDNVLRHHRRGLRVDYHHGIVADDDAGVGIAFRRVGVGVFGQLVEADLFLFEVGLRGEFLAHAFLQSMTKMIHMPR